MGGVEAPAPMTGVPLASRQKAPIPSEVLDYANQPDILIRERTDFAGLLVAPTVSELQETRELVECHG